MSLESTRDALRSSSPVVAIEAPAGCGKTHEASLAAVDMSRSLLPGQEVLLLAHTNAAVQEFRGRVRSQRARVRAMTLDSFALELLAPHAKAVGLPVPLRVQGEGSVPFSELPPKLVELFTRAPSLAVAVGRHYPIMLFDEHQDARESQHSIATTLGKCGAIRMRFFGDPMQAIYDFDGSDPVDWSAVAKESDRVEELDSPQRWEQSPRLGAWIMEARRSLRSGGSVSLRSPPPEVRIQRVSELRGEGNPKSRTVPVPLIRPLNRALDSLFEQRGHIATCVLVGSNEGARAIRSASSRRLRVYEGADTVRASASLERAISLSGDARELALLAIELLSATATGCTQGFRDQLSRALRREGVELGRQRKYMETLRQLSQLYATPDVATWCHVVARIGQDPPPGIQVDLPECFRVFSRVASSVEGDPRLSLERVIQVRKEIGHVPARCVSTIHKAKGRQFQNIVIPNCGRSHFPGTERGRRLLYVAISRAVETLTLLLPETQASPLLAA